MSIVWLSWTEWWKCTYATRYSPPGVWLHIETIGFSLFRNGSLEKLSGEVGEVGNSQAALFFLFMYDHLPHSSPPITFLMVHLHDIVTIFRFGIKISLWYSNSDEFAPVWPLPTWTFWNVFIQLYSDRKEETGANSHSYDNFSFHVYSLREK